MRVIEHIISAIAPSSCIGCETEGILLCSFCTEDVLYQELGRCYRCRALSPQHKTCKACRMHTSLSRVWIRTDYNDYARHIVHRMKFKFSREAGKIVARELAAILPDLPQDTIFVHVPTITSHVRQRGIDHAEVIAKEIASITGYRHETALARMGQHRQVGSGRQLRLSGVQQSFRTTRFSDVKGLTIVLVDDVLTTGATLEAAARVLKSAGAKAVYGAVFARSK